MTSTPENDPAGTILLVGASRGLGLAMAEEFAKRRWSVVATVRGTARTALHDLADAHPGIAIETLDIDHPDQIEALAARLLGRTFDMLFVNAGTANREDETPDDVATEEFARVLVTNALSPMRVIARLQGLVRSGGLIGAMSSGQGSLAGNTNGRHPVYRASKSALNQLMRSHAARHAEENRPWLLMAPGWIRTELGGPRAPYGIAESVPMIVDVLLQKRGRPGLEYLDRFGTPVAW